MNQHVLCLFFANFGLHPSFYVPPLCSAEHTLTNFALTYTPSAQKSKQNSELWMRIQNENMTCINWIHLCLSVAIWYFYHVGILGQLSFQRNWTIVGVPLVVQIWGSGLPPGMARPDCLLTGVRWMQRCMPCGGMWHSQNVSCVEMRNCSLALSHKSCEILCLH